MRLLRQFFRKLLKSEFTCYAQAVFMSFHTVFDVELPLFRGQVDRRHAMILRLSNDDQSDQVKAPVYGPAKAGGC